MRPSHFELQQSKLYQLSAKYFVVMGDLHEDCSLYEILVHIFYHVDNALLKIAKHGNAKLYPSEVVSIGILFALKGGHFHAFYRWLKRDYDSLFAGLPHRTALQRQLRVHQQHTDLLMTQPSVLNVVDSYPMELIFPIREGRFKQQFGGQNQDQGRL